MDRLANLVARHRRPPYGVRGVGDAALRHRSRSRRRSRCRCVRLRRRERDGRSGPLRCASAGASATARPAPLPVPPPASAPGSRTSPTPRCPPPRMQPARHGAPAPAPAGAPTSSLATRRDCVAVAKVACCNHGEKEAQRHADRRDRRSFTAPSAAVPHVHATDLRWPPATRARADARWCPARHAVTRAGALLVSLGSPSRRAIVRCLHVPSAPRPERLAAEPTSPDPTASASSPRRREVPLLLGRALRRRSRASREPSLPRTSRLFAITSARARARSSCSASRSRRARRVLVSSRRTKKRSCWRSITTSRLGEGAPTTDHPPCRLALARWWRLSRTCPRRDGAADLGRRRGAFADLEILPLTECDALSAAYAAAGDRRGAKRGACARAAGAGDRDVAWDLG